MVTCMTPVSWCRRYLRPEVPVETAIVALMDARGVLYELKVVPSCPSGML